MRSSRSSVSAGSKEFARIFTRTSSPAPADLARTRSAREAIQPTRTGGPAAPAAEPDAADDDAHRDDPAEEDVLDTAGLLSERLGAQVIEEIPHD